MEMGRAVAYIFEDKHWVSKLLPLLLVAVLSLIPIFGLIAVALGLGYLVYLAHNVRQGLPRPLPAWDDWQEKLNIGGRVLLAVIVYNLPIILMSICSYTLIAGIGSGFLGSSVSIVFICCTAPILFCYGLISWSMLAIGIAEFIETDDAGRLFHFVHLWDVLRANNEVVFQWALYALLANLVLGIIGMIPCIGQIIFFLFVYPIQGHLLGQFMHRLSIRNQPKKKGASGH